MSRESVPPLSLWIVRAASYLVPADTRPEWRREWEAEIEGRWAELRDSGRTSPSARLDLVRRSLGSVVDAIRYGEGRWSMSGFGDDMNGVARQLRRHPGFVAVVVGTLAVGVGGSTAVFGVASEVMLKPFPYPDPDHVVTVENYHRDHERVGGNTTYPNLADLADGTESFDGMGLIRRWGPALGGGDGATIVRGATVTANFFDILGVEAGEGRLFLAEEEGEGRPDVVVLSPSLWAERFASDPDVVGTDIRLNDVPYTVIGVLSQTFEDPWILGGPGQEPLLWRTVASPPGEWPRSGRSWKGIARVRSDRTIESAQADVDGAFAALAEMYPEANANRVMVIRPLRDVVAGPSRTVLLTLLAAVALLLLIACANLGNLQISRALDRRGELAVHRALGASRARILNRSVAEVLLLSMAGGGMGVVTAAWLGTLAGSLDTLLPRPVDGALDARILGFAMLVTVSCAALFGILPALRTMSTATALPGRGGGRTSTSDRRTGSLRKGLVAGQLALTTALLVASGLLGRSLHRLGAVDLGFEPSGVIQMAVHGSSFYDLGAEEAAAQWNAIMEELGSVPGVESVGAMDIVPLGEGRSCDGVWPSDRGEPPPGEGRCAEVRSVFPRTLETLGVGLVRGRSIAATDRVDSRPVLVVDEAMAGSFWPDEDPIGKGLYAHGRVAEIVGIVESLLHFGPGEAPRPMVYVPAAQEGWNGYNRGFDVVARLDDRARTVAPLREAVQRVNGSIAVGSVDTFDGLLVRNMAGPRFRTLLMTAFGTVALLLAFLGIAGSMTYSVSRRTRELGVRLALGANPSEVRTLVLKEGGRLVAVGVSFGILGSLFASRLLESLLFGIGGRDPGVYLGVVTLLVGGALLACYVPARRASRVDPKTALQSE